MESKHSDWDSIESKESEICRSDKESSRRFIEMTSTLDTHMQSPVSEFLGPILYFYQEDDDLVILVAKSKLQVSPVVEEIDSQ